MSLTMDRQTPALGGEAIPTLLYLPVAADVHIYAGALVALTGGYATPGATATSLVCVGRAEVEVDNTDGSAGAVSVPVRQGTFGFSSASGGDAIGQAQVGGLCYVVDDQTVAATNGSGTRSIAGVVTSIDPLSGIFVEMGLSRSALSQAVPAGGTAGEPLVSQGSAAPAFQKLASAGMLVYADAADNTATGSAQSIAHGLGVAPSFVLVVATDTTGTATPGSYTITQGMHTTTNVVVTATASLKFRVYAFA